LYKFITRHRHVIAAQTKETRWWLSYREGRDFYSYTNYFQVEKLINSSQLITGEATPSYLRIAQLPQQMYNVQPNAKFIVILRNPVDRSYSHYKYFANRPRANCEQRPHWIPSPEQYHRRVVRVLSKLKDNVSCRTYYSNTDCISIRQYACDCTEDMSIPDSNDPIFPCPFCDCFDFDVGLPIGAYATHLQRWFEYFPRTSFKIIRTEDLERNPVQIMNEIYEFLGLHPIYPRSNQQIFTSVHPGGGSTKHFAPMLPATRSLLIRFYRPHNQYLAQLLNDSRFLWNS